MFCIDNNVLQVNADQINNRADTKFLKSVQQLSYCICIQIKDAGNVSTYLIHLVLIQYLMFQHNNALMVNHTLAR